MEPKKEACARPDQARETSAREKPDQGMRKWIRVSEAGA
jgi:hypothetical protein